MSRDPHVWNIRSCRIYCDDGAGDGDRDQRGDAAYGRLTAMEREENEEGAAGPGWALWPLILAAAGLFLSSPRSATRRHTLVS